ncbi:MAG: VOC family protein [Planctomycetota bacterium]
MKLGYLIYYVADVSSTVDYYSRAFDMKCRFHHTEGHSEYAEMETGETVLAFASDTLAESHGFSYQKMNPDGPPPPVEIAFVTDNVEEGYRKAISEGADGKKEPTEMPWGQTVSYVCDPNGFLIEICSPMKPAE